MIFTKTWFRKLKIKGKGYYIYKNFRNTVTYQFGYSHRAYIHLFNVNVKFLSKTVILIFGLSKSDIFLGGLEIWSAKPINLFTGRGVRFSKQVVYKKTGKVSSYR
jgi:ribosomal protein L6P/L9E